MSDDNRSDDEQREQLRTSNELLRQERERRIEQIRRSEAADAAVGEFAREVAAAHGRGAEAAFRGQHFDPAPHIQPIAERLREALRALQQAGRFSVLDDMDTDATFNHYSWQAPFDSLSQEHARNAFDYALRRLHEAVKDDRIDLVQLVKDVLFDNSARPAAQWFRMLLSMVQGELRYEPKPKHSAASASPGGAAAVWREADQPKRATPEGGDATSGFLGGVALADALGVHASRRDAFFKQLERNRKELGDEPWREVANPRPNSPRFLYRADAPRVRELAAAYKDPKPA
jgi:hypothetical protein